MAHKTYTTDDLKKLVMDQVNKVKGISASFGISEADEAYDQAVTEVGFETPVATDSDLDVKNLWLINRMRRWFISQLSLEYILRFDTGDLRASQLSKNLERMVTRLDEEFKAAKESEATAHIFIKASNVFGDDLVLTSGFLEDGVGQDISYIGQDKAATRPKQPTSTQDVIGNK